MRIGLLFLFAINLLAQSNLTGPHTICKQHAELLKRDHLQLGARIDTANPTLAKQFKRALNFWTSVLDMQWYEENSDACSLQLTDARPGFLEMSIAAQAQDPMSSDFQGWIQFNPTLTLTETELYNYSVHEIGHLLGLEHNPRHRSVMYFEDAPGPERLDATDLVALAAIHKLRLRSTSRAIYLQNSVWNHVPDFQQVRERFLMNRFPGGFMTMLATGKRAPRDRTPAQIASMAAPTDAVCVLTHGITTVDRASRRGSPTL
ncbi:MAG: matrixin family metalloprotease [Bryobacteraceae bacterium]